MIGAVNYLLSLLALKLTGTRRVSHVDDLAADPGAALFAGLTALPKTTALTSYSYRLDHTRQTRLLTGLGKAMIDANLITDTGGDLDLDFHAIMHWGQDVALEKHYVPTRSQRTRSVLSFFAQDGASQTLVYANADLSKATRSGAERLLDINDHARVEYARTTSGVDPLDADYFHLRIDSTAIDMQTCVDLIVAAGRARLSERPFQP